MVVNIGNVILKFIGLGIFDNYQANINIYDGNYLIYQGRTYNGELCLKLECNRAYRLEAYNYSRRIITSFYVLKGENKYILIFNNTRTIIFLLTDANYYNLPIEKGVMFFG